jgi:hypothetical protein
MNISFQVYDEEGVSEYVQSLKKIEKNISYPLENGTESFRISHGKAYTTFFTNQGYKTRFLIIKDSLKVIGGCVGVWKNITISKQTNKLLYIADLKLKKNYRGKGIIKKSLLYLFIRWPFIKSFQGWDLIYFCAMQRDEIGVDQTFRGIHLGKLANPIAQFFIFMVDPKFLINHNFSSLKYKPEKHINLSQKQKKNVLWNDGIKDIILRKNDQKIQLGHLNPEIFINLNENRFGDAIKEVKEKKGSFACFAIDIKEQEKLDWLKKMGLQTKTKCKIFSFNPFFIRSIKSNMFYISTGEI